jgi:hypothetical protein
VSDDEEREGGGSDSDGNGDDCAYDDYVREVNEDSRGTESGDRNKDTTPEGAAREQSRTQPSSVVQTSSAGPVAQQIASGASSAGVTGTGTAGGSSSGFGSRSHAVPSVPAFSSATATSAALYTPSPYSTAAGASAAGRRPVTSQSYGMYNGYCKNILNSNIDGSAVRSLGNTNKKSASLVHGDLEESEGESAANLLEASYLQANDQEIESPVSLFTIRL